MIIDRMGLFTTEARTHGAQQGFPNHPSNPNRIRNGSSPWLRASPVSSFRQLLAAALIVTAYGSAARAVDPAPVQPEDPLLPPGFSEGNKTTISESNAYFYLDYAPTFRVSY